MSNDFFSKIAVIILAGGKGTRMESDLPKVLHTIEEKPLVEHTLNTLKQLEVGEIILVVGYQENLVRKTLGYHLKYASQPEQLGTGHAVMQALPLISQDIDTIMVLNGDDSAFYKSKTISKIIDQHLVSKAKMTILTTVQEDVDISGRVIRDQEGKMTGIKANSKLSEEELRNNNELVCGLYLFNREWLESRLPKVEISPKKEYNITGLIEIAIQEGVLKDIRLNDPNEWKSINTQRELQKAQLHWKKLNG